MKKILTIDTSKSKRSEDALFKIDKDLKKCHTKIMEISEIKFNVGPGSFTGLRIGAAIANSLMYLLKIPINKEKELVFPKYQ